MKSVKEVKDLRRKGTTLCKLLENILKSEGLLREHKNPFEVLRQSGISLQKDEVGEFLDMTSERWCELRVDKQIEYASAYQAWYANQVCKPIEKTFEAKGCKIVMRLIPPGKFWMGSSEDKRGRRKNEVGHKVLISHVFWCGKYAVTQEQWEKIKEKNLSRFKGETLPVENVSWESSQSFCEKSGFKLLTEAEWEYTCRAGTTTLYSLGDSDSDLARAGWYNENSGDNIHPVGQKTENAWGMYDMHGNIWERCKDFYKEYPNEEVVDPTNPTDTSSGSNRVRRGGSWTDSAENCRSARRITFVPVDRYENLGLRVSKSFP